MFVCRFWSFPLSSKYIIMLPTGGQFEYSQLLLVLLSEMLPSRLTFRRVYELFSALFKHRIELTILQVIRTFNLGIYVYKETRILIPKCGSLLICLWMIWMQIRIFNVSWQIMLAWFCFIGASVLLFFELVFCLFWLSRLPMHFLYLTSNHQKQSFLSDRVACRTVWYN